MNQINEQQSAQQKDAVLQASLDFISTLTGMTPPPIEVAPPEVFAPFKAFADRVCAIFSQPLAPISGLSCACVFQGDECVEQCKLHAAWLKTQHASDSKELRRLCQERDDLRRANSLHKVNTAALESSVGHLSTLVDELRRLLGAAMQTMTELHGSAAPDESTADIDARIPGAAFAKFVNDHAQLLFEIKNGCAAAPVFIFPATAVAEGAQLDGESLEQGE